MKKFIMMVAMVAAFAVMATMSMASYAVDVDVPSSTDCDVLATTTQVDIYKATIEWGDMTFNYDFGTWDAVTHTWGGSGWAAAGFNGTKDKINVTNHSSKAITASFSYAVDSGNGSATVGTFTVASGNLYGSATGTMALTACPVGGPAPFDSTYLNLAGIPSHGLINATKIGTITVTIAQ